MEKEEERKWRRGDFAEGCNGHGCCVVKIRELNGIFGYTNKKSLWRRLMPVLLVLYLNEKWFG